MREKSMNYKFLILAASLIPALSQAVTAAKPVVVVPPPAPSKYFVIQNIATEKTRVYERCNEGPDCAHKMIFETDTVVGRPEEGTPTDRYAFITWLGHSKIAEWVKFYTDAKKTYPSWYTPGQDLNTIPASIVDSGGGLGGSKKWTIKTADGGTTMYGAFGWYAAKLNPQDETNGVNYQWMHGTIGWGRDGAAAIEVTRGFLLNLFSNPGSHGCTRMENRAIALLRQMLPVGTDIYRVYARESTREQEVITGVFKKTVTPLPRYADKYGHPGAWDYVLLTDGAQKSGGVTADAIALQMAGVAILQGQNFIEQGTFLYDQYPNAAGGDYNYPASSGKTGDRYQIDSGNPNGATNFQGYYLVDEGRFIDYRHPDEQAVSHKIHVSGLPDFRDSVPDFLRTTGEHHPAAITYHRNGNQGGAN
jgi:hypothetical protein